jgi:hypothetical protein
MLPERRLVDVHTSLHVPDELIINLLYGIPVNTHLSADGSVLPSTYHPQVIAETLAFLEVHKTRFHKHGYAVWLDVLRPLLDLHVLPGLFFPRKYTQNLRDHLIPNARLLLPSSDLSSMPNGIFWHGKHNGLPTPTVIRQISELRSRYPGLPIIFGIESDSYIQSVGQKPFCDQNFRGSLFAALRGIPFHHVMLLNTPSNPDDRPTYWRSLYGRLKPKILAVPDDVLFAAKKRDVGPETAIYTFKRERRVSQSALRRGRLAPSVLKWFPDDPNLHELSSAWRECPECGI